MALNKQNLERLHFFDNIITFNFIDLSFTLIKRKLLRLWVVSTIVQENFSCGVINFNFCSDEYLLKLNRKHLNHDYYTDIITFDIGEAGLISGDIYISVDRVKDNAKQNNTPFAKELHRVMIHGILHLCGYKDSSINEKRLMRNKENKHLAKLDLFSRENTHK